MGKSTQRDEDSVRPTVVCVLESIGKTIISLLIFITDSSAGVQSLLKSLKSPNELGVRPLSDAMNSATKCLRVSASDADGDRRHVRA